MAKKIKHGKRFEEDFIKSVPDRCDITRLKDAGGWSKASNTRFTSSNPCDFIVFSKQFAGDFDGLMYKLELKSVMGKALPYSNIKDHQLDSLCESAQKGVRAVFIVNFRSTNETFMIHAETMKRHIEAKIPRSNKKSLSLEDARKYGTLIPQTLIRVRWRYDLEGILR